MRDRSLIAAETASGREVASKEPSAARPNDIRGGGASIDTFVLLCFLAEFLCRHCQQFRSGSGLQFSPFDISRRNVQRGIRHRECPWCTDMLRLRDQQSINLQPPDFDLV
jgi:hypothetical protein